MMIKKTSLKIFSFFVLTLPMLVSAQYTAPKDTKLPTGELATIITNIMNWLLVILGVIGVIGFVIAGIFYLTAAGNDDQISTAKKAMTWSVVGVIVGLVGLVIITAVETMLGGTDPKF
ncbi:MAG: hypothetical protein WC682_03890 [Parcubacteria group bacterium]|jgi:hypothetical protein